MEEIEAKVSGRVTGVMYRDFVQRKARGLGIVGTVENLDGGIVRIVAQGTREELDRLIEHLHKGPFLARVMRVDVSWREPSQSFKGFQIVY